MLIQPLAKASRRLRIAVIGSGISGLSAAWLLSRDHDVTLYEKNDRIGGHSNTVTVQVGDDQIPVDTGFIVFNRKTYPNLVALFEHLKVPTQSSDMSFAVSLDGGRVEYSGNGLAGLFGQRERLLDPAHWSMLLGLVRFYRRAAADLPPDERTTLGEYLAARRYSAAFRDRHLLPIAAAIWSSTPDKILAYPMRSFIRFFDNHGLLELGRRAAWETVSGGSRNYVSRLLAAFAGSVRLNAEIVAVLRDDARIRLVHANGLEEIHDRVLVATHADEALALLGDASPLERELLGAFRYSRNQAVLHTDESLMPARRSLWSSWNYLGTKAGASGKVCVTYWMNRLQNLASDQPLFVTLNPVHSPRPGSVLHSEVYDHPLLDNAATSAQQRLWALQGLRNSWFCGAYFGAGFHEDGLQAGLAAAEDVGGVRRPWTVEGESGRIYRLGVPAAAALEPAR